MRPFSAVHFTHGKSSSAVFWNLAEPIALAVGSSNPQRHGRMILAVLDGLLLDRLTHDPSDDELVGDSLRALLHGIAAANS